MADSIANAARNALPTSLASNAISTAITPVRISTTPLRSSIVPSVAVARSVECAYRATKTTSDDVRYVSSHDLRRRFAQRLLVDHSMDPCVVMAVGWWDSFQAIEPYLNAFSPEVVNDAFEDAGLA
jgi:hypothetical protein